MSPDIKVSKAQINKLIKEGGTLRSILAPLGKSAAMSATDAAIQKKFMVMEQKQ